MAQVEEKQFLQEVEKQKKRSIYFFVGEEAGKIDFYLRTLEKEILGGPRNSFNFESHYTDQIKAAPLLDSLGNESLWQGPKVVVLKRLEKWAAKEQENFLSVLEQDLGATTLILVAEKLDGRSKFSQAVNKSSQVAVVKCEALKDIEWSHWLRTLCAAKNIKLSAAARENLLQVGFGSVLDLDQILGKALLFADKDQTIDLEHLSKVQFIAPPESIFAFTEAVMAKRAKEALEVLWQLEQQGEEPLQLLALVARNFRLLQQILSLKKEGKSESTICSEMRLLPRQAKSLFGGLGKRQPRELSRCIKQIAQVDHGLKSTREPPFQALQRLSIELTTHA